MKMLENNKQKMTTAKNASAHARNRKETSWIVDVENIKFVETNSTTHHRRNAK
jgi:hypothetical protein